MILAPTAPGAIGQAPSTEALSAFLQALLAWTDGRRSELDEIDQAARSADHSAEVTDDLMLSLALWKAVKDRQALVLATWDSGRVGQAERDRIASLIWGRLDATLDPSLLARSAVASGLALSLPEACRLSDALAGQLRRRLRLEPDNDRYRTRVTSLRAQLERLRDQVALEPPEQRATAQGRVGELERRIGELQAKADRGGDIGGLIGPLEGQAATTERDLIVAAARRREAAGKADQARALRQDLTDRAAGLVALVAQCVATVDPAPRYAVPDVAGLGPVPDTGEDLDRYLQRLDKVSQALQVVQHAYSAAVDTRTALATRLAAQRSVSGTDPLSTATVALADQVLATQPTPVEPLRLLLEAHRSLLDRSPRPDPPTRTDLR